jgi:hypothetical protein
VRATGQGDDRWGELARPPPLPLPDDDDVLGPDAEAIRERIARRLFGTGPPNPSDAS